MMNRRDFLKLAGVAAGAPLVMPSIALAKSSRDQAKEDILKALDSTVFVKTGDLNSNKIVYARVYTHCPLSKALFYSSLELKNPGVQFRWVFTGDTAEILERRDIESVKAAFQFRKKSVPYANTGIARASAVNANIANAVGGELLKAAGFGRPKRIPYLFFKTDKGLKLWYDYDYNRGKFLRGGKIADLKSLVINASPKNLSDDILYGRTSKVVGEAKMRNYSGKKVGVYSSMSKSSFKLHELNPRSGWDGKDTVLENSEGRWIQVRLYAKSGVAYMWQPS
ncbi:twin-arginine translocation signal domain-containing protein [Thiomicrorhabdus sp. 6S2-11]|uniref:Twin-arginine translocation signal domain-containing protein n=1 Tax=Thiomicrorhabdus marina TaxID=2818442 RepID=A0ABS3Q6N1_9GAMM|nr:twin-arginine translocation signal domain-containing protein [Thiomicrorhabdus marina]MBO1927490.1 twin-arginine translocation signal domain-containing protein [Thiomicrorhabdus marina]